MAERTDGSPPATLVAGIGNIFHGDDGFGSEVARRLLREPIPDGVRVVDYGIGGIHLAYDLLDGVDLLVLIDAIPRDGVQPGTLSVIEADAGGLPPAPLDSHAMDPAAVLANVRSLGGEVPRTLIVGCQPADVNEGMVLSDAVEAAVEPAVALVREVLDEHAPARPVGAANDAKE